MMTYRPDSQAFAPPAGTKGVLRRSFCRPLELAAEEPAEPHRG